MAAITDPQAIRFVNEQIRPLCEKLRALMVEITANETTWFAGLNIKFPNDISAVTDNREGEGVSRLTGADINSVMTIAIAMRNAGNTEIIAKPCVRGISVG
jgi:hypothetical protein